MNESHTARTGTDTGNAGSTGHTGHTGRRKRFSAEEIVNKLRQAEVLISQGQSISQASKQLSITDQTYYRWRKEYGGLKTDQAKRLKELERENSRLKKLVADLSLDKAILEEACRGN